MSQKTLLEIEGGKSQKASNKRQAVNAQTEIKRPVHNTTAEKATEKKATTKSVKIVDWDKPDERYRGFTLREVSTMKGTVLKPQNKETEMTPEEVIQFCHLAKTYKLDPFAKEIWGIKTKSMLSIEASASGWRKIIRRQENFKKLTINPWYSKDDIEFDHIAGRVTKHVQKGSIGGKPFGAYCMVEYEDGASNLSIALWEEYGQPAEKKGKYGTYDTPWRYRQEMIKNKASAIFGRTYCGVSGLYAMGEGTEKAEIIENANDQKFLPKPKGNDAKAKLRNKKKNKKR